MDYVVIGILVVGAVILVARPMLSKQKYLHDLEGLFDLGDTRRLNYLNQRKLNTLENIRELDFDYQMGKLADEDYQGLRQEYMHEAEEIIEAIDKLKIQAEIEELIEEEVRSRRRIQ